eukprot:CAMPEP_0197256032 /NCGR_PEP_ID=MMETSP1429-20130617/73975_1 /TAXON_ID=49237 /ORGANISM="Chaetoceros  sp., Strain UNC1202" /LENGTH=51 /DNA_ID=CAMNT_0042719481 /DNA_START=72 /DNA_END=224 /DNA_ORIENTATION=-
MSPSGRPSITGCRTIQPFFSIVTSGNVSAAEVPRKAFNISPSTRTSEKTVR